MQKQVWRIRKLSTNQYQPDQDLDFGPFTSSQDADKERGRLMQTPEFQNAKLRIVADPSMRHGFTNMDGI